MGRSIVIAAALTVIAVFASVSMPPATSFAGNDCGNVETESLTATQLKLRGGLECEIAQTVLKLYFRKVERTEQEENGCAQKRFERGCRVFPYKCFARMIRNETRGHCEFGKLEIRFKEIARRPT